MIDWTSSNDNCNNNSSSCVVVMWLRVRCNNVSFEPFTTICNIITLLYSTKVKNEVSKKVTLFIHQVICIRSITYYSS